MIKQLLILLIILLIALLILSNSHTNTSYVFDDEHFDSENTVITNNTQTNDMGYTNPNTKNQIVGGPLLTQSRESDNSSSSNSAMSNLNDSIVYVRAEDEDPRKCKSLSPEHCGSESGKCSPDTLHPIMDPKFNMRESAKQCLLLEDHLNNTKKRCYDCIRKHFLTTDGFLEEAVSLEKDNSMRDYYRKLYLDWVKIEKSFAKNPTDSNNLDNISKEIRAFRKPLLEKYFDNVSEYNE